MPTTDHEDDIISDLQRVAKDLGHAPLTTEYERLGTYSSITVRKYLGKSWRECLAKANLVPTSEHRSFWSDQDLDNELARLKAELGRDPTFTDIRQYSTISIDTFLRRTGREKIIKPSDPPLSPDWRVDAIDPELGSWVAGFVCGEGAFIVDMGTVEFRVGVRADDRELLELAASTLDIPVPVRIYSNARRRSLGQNVGDEARLSVPNRRVLKARVIPFFDRFKIRGRKQLDFGIFKEAVLFLSVRDENGHFHQRFTDHEKSVLRDLTNRIQALRHDPTSHSSSADDAAL